MKLVPTYVIYLPDRGKQYSIWEISIAHTPIRLTGTGHMETATLWSDRDRLNPFLGDCMEPGFNRNEFDVDLILCTGCIVSYPAWFELSEYVFAVNVFKFMDL